MTGVQTCALPIYGLAGVFKKGHSPTLFLFTIHNAMLFTRCAHCSGWQASNSSCCKLGKANFLFYKKPLLSGPSAKIIRPAVSSVKKFKHFRRFRKRFRFRGLQPSPQCYVQHHHHAEAHREKYRANVRVLPLGHFRDQFLHHHIQHGSGDRKSTRLNSSHPLSSRMPSSA